MWEIEIMHEFWTNFKKSVTLEKVIVRLIMAWLLTAVMFCLKSQQSFNSAEFAAEINTVMYLCFVLLFFIIFCALGYLKVFSWMEAYGPMILVTLYAMFTISGNSELPYLIGVLAFLGICVVYAVNKTKDFADIKKKGTVVIIYVVAALFYMGIAGTTTVLRYVNYSSPAFDFGIWAQMFHNMRESFQPVTTVERERLLSHFAVHFSPIYYIYLPVYFIFPYPATLQILQVITLASGIIPVYLLCRKFELSKSATAAFGVIFALFPVLTTGCFYDLHENCFLVPLLLWLFYFIEKDDIKGMIAMSLLTVLVKEDAPMYISCIGLYVIIGKRKYVKGTIMLMFGVAYFLTVTMLMRHFGLGVMSNRYENYMVGSSGGLMDVIKNFITNPAYVISESFKEKKYQFIIYMLVPLGFIPAATKNVSKFILLLPVIIINLASDYVYQYSIYFQYAFGTMAILTYLAVSNYAELSEKSRRFMCSLAVCGAVIVMPVAGLSRTYYIDNYVYNKENIKILDEVMDSIPKDASVSASTFFVAHLSNREELYSYPAIHEKNVPADYLVLDLRYDGLTADDRSFITQYGYEKVSGVDGLYALYYRGDDAAVE